MNKPMIRFEGYDEDWEEVKLGDVVDLLTSSLRAKDLEIDGEYPVYDANDLIGYHSTCLSDREYISIIKDGAGVGRMRSLNGHTNITSTMNGLLPNKNFDSNYVVQSLDMIEFDKYVIGTTIPHIYYKDYKSEVLLVPTLPEQEQIGNFFKTLDDLISAEEEQLQNYEQYKSAMLQKMFPRKGKSFPEIRFSGYDEDWEEKKLKELYTKGFSGGTPSTSVHEYYNGKIPFLAISDIDGRYINKTEKHITEEGLDNSSAKMVKPNSISLAMYASVGRVGVTTIPISTSQAFFNMEFDDDSLVEYLYTYLIRMDKYNMWRKLIGEGTQKNLNAGKVSNYKIKLPKSKKEQEQIGNFFKALDEVIRKKQEKIEQLKETKEAFLQKMFV